MIMCISSMVSTIMKIVEYELQESELTKWLTYSLMWFVIAQNLMVIIIFCIRILSMQCYRYLNDRRISSLIKSSRCTSDPNKVELIPDSKENELTPSSDLYMENLLTYNK